MCLDELCARLHDDVACRDVSERGGEWSDVACRQTDGKVAYECFAAQHIPDERLSAETHADAFVGQVLTATTTVTAGLEAKSCPGSVEHAVVYIKVAYHAGRLAAASDASMPLFRQAMAHDNVFRGLVHAQTVLTASCLHGEAVVATTQCAVFDEYVSGGFDVDAVATGYTYGVYGDAPDDDAVAIDRHYVPEWCTFQRYSFDEYIPAIGR